MLSCVYFLLLKLMLSCVYFQALDSFLLVFNQQGNIVYTSESVTSLLGHLPVSIKHYLTTHSFLGS
jgi:hypothetical protein